MKKLLLPLVAAAALAAPASAFAWGGGHDRHGGIRFGGFSALTKLSGTGTSFGSTSATASGTGFTAALSTTWSSAQTKTFADNSIKCAPATASITTNGTTTSYTGKTCSWTRNGTTKYGFMGAASNGTRAVLGEDGTTVKGAVFKAHKPMKMGAFAASHSGNCDHR